MTIISRPTSPLTRRLRPLQAAAFLQGFAFWVPVEKLFMNEIGFTAASVGLMATAYAAVVPILEVPSGILADRWSRRGVLIVSSVALALSALIGGLSQDVPTYIVGAPALGVFFAMQSGTIDSIVYDTVLEETGDSAAFEHHIGRIRLLASAAGVVSALAGGALAGLTDTRMTYLLTVPVVALSIAALLRVNEPRLHRAGAPTSVRAHIGLTYRRSPAEAVCCRSSPCPCWPRSSCRCSWSSGRYGWSRWPHPRCCTGRTGPVSCPRSELADCWPGGST